MGDVEYNLSKATLDNSFLQTQNMKNVEYLAGINIGDPLQNLSSFQKKGLKFEILQ
ncbi:hypothetical protein HK096_001370, partial [Nowakowskiella sp. JEL0078]